MSDADTRRTPVLLLTAVATVVLLVSLPVATALGATSIPWSEVVEVWRSRLQGVPSGATSDTIVWNIRAPRVLLAAVVGAGLAIAGTVVQTLVRNPLADPYLLGVSSGASVGATAVITLGVLSSTGTWALSVGAMIGAVIAAAAVFGLAMGQLLLPLVATVVAALLLVALRGWLDALLAGPDVAASLGVPVARLRVALFVLQALLVGVLVAVAGGIGFVGLIVPHVARLLVGPLHGRMVPVAALVGAIFLVWVDVAARTLATPQDIPLSVVTGVVGAPVFLVLLGRRRYRFGGES